MSKLTFKLMIVTLCLSIAVVSCKKEEDTSAENKPAAQENKKAPLLTYTFNGGDRDLSKTSSLRFIAEGGLGRIEGSFKGENVNETIEFTFSKNVETKTYSLNEVPELININYYIDLNEKEEKRGGAPHFFSYTVRHGELTFSKFDVKSKEASGTFSFTAIDFNYRDTIVVTDGKFNFKK